MKKPILELSISVVSMNWQCFGSEHGDGIPPCKILTSGEGKNIENRR